MIKKCNQLFITVLFILLFTCVTSDANVVKWRGQHFIEHGGRGYNVQVALIPLTPKDGKPIESWTLLKKPESINELIEQFEKQTYKH